MMDAIREGEDDIRKGRCYIKREKETMEEFLESLNNITWKSQHSASSDLSDA